MWRLARALWSNSDGAVAPTVALSLIGLVAVGGVAFDYAHLAAMDTELQQAADQAALAAATQLDGQTGAIARATAAAQSLLTNKSLLAGSGKSGSAVDVPSANIVFCSAFDDSKADTAAACTATTVDKDARVVWIKTGGRTANYTLTPIVGLLSSGSIAAEAVAGLSSAVCKEPPVMMCNPNSNPASFNVSSYVGKGMLLIATSGGGSYAPGNFGFLDVGAGGSDLQKLMGYGSPPDQCVDVSQPSTETGALTSVVNEFNTRFDIYESGDSINCFSGSKCPPSLNSRKDVVMNDVAPFTKSNCGIVTGGGGKGWQVSSLPYRPTDSSSTYTANPDAMGYPRDKCHAFNDTGDCLSAYSTPSDRIGTGDWDIDAYWRTNHPTGTNGAVMLDAGLPTQRLGYPTSLNSTIRAAFPLSVDATRSYPTRYQVYRWEMANAATELTQKSVVGGISYPQPVCRPPGWSPGGTTPDRRTLPVAVVNCTGLNGKKAVNPIDWVDTFLVEPSMSRDNGLTGASKVTYTNVGDIYVEVIGHTGNGTGGSNAQFVRHDRPYLIR
jgi:Flp pilus assembly protein TadG